MKNKHIFLYKEHIKGLLPLENYARQYMELDRTGTKYICPICKSGTHKNGTSALTLYPKSQLYTCFACESEDKRTGDVFALIQYNEGLADFLQAYCRACELVGIDPYEEIPGLTEDKPTGNEKSNNQRKQAKNNKSEVNTLDINTYVEPPQPTAEELELKEKQCKEYEKVVSYFDTLTNEQPAEVVEYLKKRKITKEQVKKYLLGCYYDNSEKCYRLVIPYPAKPYYHIDRAIKENPRKKYKKPASEDVGAEPLFTDNFQRTNNFILCEGVIDCLTLESLDPAIPTLPIIGGRVSNKIINNLRKSNYKGCILLLNDDDVKGREYQKSNFEKLSKELPDCYVFNLDNFYKYFSHLKKSGEDKLDPQGIYEQVEEKAFISILTAEIKKTAQLYHEQRKARLESELQALNEKNEVFYVENIYKTQEKLFSTKERQRRTSTGFEKLDNLLGGGLTQNLYVIGAESSFGKTTFCNQIADNIAESGQPVLFATIEQTSKELMAKSHARISWQIDKRTALTATHYLENIPTLYNPIENEEIKKQAKEYYFKNIAPNLYHLQGLNPPKCQDVLDYAQKIGEKLGKMPVLFVDYLQILQAEFEGLMERKNVDTHLSQLRIFANQYKTPVFVISSFSRGAYTGTVERESFKESGGIEYGADVLLGLQLRGITEFVEQLHKKCNNERQFKFGLREHTKSETASDFRTLELAMLKNRNGVLPKEPLPLDFRANNSVFVER